ncbi:MAG: hypothetical protein RJQ08_03860 [Salinisphaeraceae bacterium]
MARGTSLTNLLIKLRSEMGLSDSVAQSVSMLDTMKYKLAAVQERLWHEYDWNFMRGDEDVTMAAGTRYYDLPVDPGRIDTVHVKWSNGWLPLEYGIGPEQYNQFNGDETKRYEPALRWGFYTGAGGEQFEIWPLPSTATQTVRFRGMRNLGTLVSGTDTADLDDHLIVLFTAAALIKDPAKATTKLREANSHLQRMKRNYGPATASFSLGGNRRRSVGRPGPVRVAYPASS